MIQTHRAQSFFDKVNLSTVTVVDYGFKFSINSNKYEITYINFFLDCGLSVNVYRVEKVYSIYVKTSYINFPFLISLCGLILSFKKCNVLLRFTCDTYLEITYGYSLSSTSTQPQRKRSLWIPLLPRMRLIPCAFSLWFAILVGEV